LGRREDEPSTVTVLGHEIIVDEEFLYLGSLVHSVTQKALLISHVAMPLLIWLYRI